MSDFGISEERKSVISNIEAALADGDTFRKVELFDPVITDEVRKKRISRFDNLKRSPVSKVKAYFARKLAEGLTAKVNLDTEIVGIENALAVKGGAVITSNHYNPTDSTPIRLMAYECGRRKGLHIIVQETNVMMTGLFGFLMNNCNTMPVSPDREYMVKNLTPAIEKVLSRGDFLLVYPEQEMWFNYKRPRAHRDGAYHWAATYGVPIIPTFTEMRSAAGERDGDGFLPVKHILHIMPPIYPEKELSVRENRVIMKEKDEMMRRELYEKLYGVLYDAPFFAERDIAGYV